MFKIYFGSPKTAAAAGGGGGHSWVPFVDMSHIKINHGEPHPELNRPRIERERAERMAEDEAVLLLIGAL